MSLKNLRSLVCTIAVATATFSASALTQGETFTVGNFTYSYMWDNLCTVTSYDNSATEVTVPATVQAPDGTTLKIDQIGDRAFYGSIVTKVNLPEGLSAIKTDAFSNSQLQSLHLPASVYYIYDCAFNNTPINEITVAAGNTSFQVVDGVLYLNTQGRHFLFLYPRNKAADVYNVASGCLGINGGAFYNCPVKKVVLPSTIQSINSHAFYGSALEEINLEKNIFLISDNCFANSNLKTITLPDNMWSVQEDCFKNCKQLYSVTLPLGNEYIYNGAFYGCVSLGEIICKEAFPADFDDYTEADCPFGGMDRSKVTIYVPNAAGVVDEYKNSQWGELFTNIKKISDRNPAGISSAATMSVTVSGGKALTVALGSESSDVAVFNTAGASVASQAAATGTVTFNVAPGLYLVNVAGNTYKAVVR